MPKRTSEFGTLYKGSLTGQASWLAHRLTGVGILLFLFAHIVDTALVGWGPETYNKVIAVYHHPIIQIMELGLVGAVIFHALNGVKIMIIDFWPATAVKQKQLTMGTVALFLASMAPITWFMGQRIIEKIMEDGIF